MDLFQVVGAFGGGVFGAAVGALPAFVITSVLAIAGGVLSMAGLPDVSIGNITFGAFLGPHVIFASGVAAAAYAARKGIHDHGANVAVPLNGLKDPGTLLVGGIFGVIGILLKYFFQITLHLDGSWIAYVASDPPSLSLITSAIIVRLFIARQGLFGDFEKGEHKIMPDAKSASYTILLGCAYGLVTSGVGISLMHQGVDVSSYPVLCFGIAGVGLVFAQTGSAYFVCHHILLPAAMAAVLSGNIIVGTITGGACAIIGLFVENIFNQFDHVRSHIDPPAFTIIVVTFVLHAIFGG
ncbi:hypothetical protein [uncultured Pseudoramibacter sp.]|uniref:hypothetical protein n=1 Tax=uncultured Pseudoramibacter sp. TaxID=1623493 RepID=UPI0025CBEA90|nr:hypothetical protein [uncultured Pseudoramibacter sp.]